MLKWNVWTSLEFEIGWVGGKIGFGVADRGRKCVIDTRWRKVRRKKEEGARMGEMGNVYRLVLAGRSTSCMGDGYSSRTARDDGRRGRREG